MEKVWGAHSWTYIPQNLSLLYFRSRIVSNIFLAYFVVEIILRFIGIGPRTFTRLVSSLSDRKFFASPESGGIGGRGDCHKP